MVITPVAVGFIGIAAIVLLIALRTPIWLALAGVAIVGLIWVRNANVAWSLLRTIPFEFTAHWSLSAVPMFLLMSAVAHNSGMSAALYRAARLWLGFLPGGLAVASNIACAGFSAVSGSSLATAAAMGRIAIPEMLQAGYNRGLAAGTVASAGTLGSLIPPSILMILYGVFTEQSIARLFLAGVLPGMLTAAVYSAMIVTRCALNPRLAPRYRDRVSWGERISALGAVWPILLLMAGMIGGLYLGLVSPTEAGALGAFLAMVIAYAQGALTWRTFRASIVEALTATASIFIIAIGAALLTRFLVFSGAPLYLGEIAGQWSAQPLPLILAMSLVFVLLGMFLDPIGIMLISLPIFLPMMKALDLDLIWFGVLVIKYLEIGLLTPPVGFSVYVIKGVIGDAMPVESIFRGVGWFLACEVVVVALLIGYPQISLFLPQRMLGG